ncbi:retron system putative HNH endonuclease [Rhizobium sp. CCGE 510]|uniref:retron system putative HNH endonuclease n=1 Tax=Rhizobium sp. CCGE 510 TaxID=1132836 RepID=UPI00027B8E1E|nr:retron system putative HNH endonuclease [Rhizobium sp. CCGE 510]EJT05008.1 ATPase AAA [Rhizobium sp. CCGE 510]
MRYVDRSRTSVPKALLSDRVRAAIEDVQRFMRRSEDEKAQRRSPYDESIIHRSEVPQALSELFFHKCAYCESRSANTIDHFRPKSLYPWLAYDWENLYPTCFECDRRKGGAFPMAAAPAPPFSTIGEARAFEHVLFVDPCFDDPRAHLRFCSDGRYQPLTDKGQGTIGYLDLNRKNLVWRRNEVIERIITRLEFGLQNSPALETFIEPEAEFSGAATQYLSLLLETAIGRRPAWRRYGPSGQRLMQELYRVEENALRSAAAQLREGSDAFEPDYNPSRVMRPAHEVRPPAPAAISVVEINNFKSIGNLTLHVPPLRKDKGTAGALMLLGENAAGKSSVLEAIALTMLSERESSGLVEAEDLLRRKGAQRLELVDTEPVSVKISFHDRPEPAVLNVDPLKRRIESTPQPRSVVIGYGPRRYSKDGAPWLKSKSARVRSLFHPAVALPDPAAWLREIAVSESNKFNAVARGLREILALRESDDLVLDELMGVCVRVQGRLEPVGRLSEGYRSLFAMAVDIMRELLQDQPELENARGVVLIDEVETHLHPRWKMRVMSALRRAMPNVTFIATTHDPLCLRGMENGEVIVLFKDVDRQIAVMEDLPDITGMRAEQILTSDYFGLNSTADPEIEANLTDYVEALTRANSGDQRAQEDASRLGQALRSTLVLGDTAADQIIQEALGRFLSERRDLPPIERSSSRKEVVERMLGAFRKPLDGA